MSSTEFAVPPGTAEAAKTSLNDELAADARAADGKHEYPPGCPTLLPMHRLEWEDRATAVLVMGEIMDLQKTHGGKLRKGQTLTAEQGAGFFKMLGAIARYLAVAAEDKVAWQAWEGRLDQDTLITAFNVYQEAEQPGEASSSSS